MQTQSSEFRDRLALRELQGDVDVVFVLRNHDHRETSARMEYAIPILTSGLARSLVMVYEPHTKAEAEAAALLALDLGWTSMCIVTHWYHAPRAFLTFIRSMKRHGVKIDLYQQSVYLDPPSRVDLHMLELEKIGEYQVRGDVDGYTEGICYLMGES
jgi:hypothetical protein